MTQELTDFSNLTAPFAEYDLQWRVQQGGIGSNGLPWAIVIPYVDARAIMDRLDSVVGPENWQDEYHHVQGGVLAKLGIRINGEWIYKQDGSDETDIEAFKGGLSKALVRVAVKWNIGRYLYVFPVCYADFTKVDKTTKGAIYAKIQEKHFYWLPPKVPAHFLPKERVQEKKEERKQEASKAAAAAEVIASKRTEKDVQADIVGLCKARGIKPSELNTVVASKFDLNSTKDLTIEQLEELLEFLDGGMK